MWGSSAMRAFSWPALPLSRRFDMLSDGAMGTWGHGVAQHLVLEGIVGNLKRNLNGGQLQWGVRLTTRSRGSSKSLPSGDGREGARVRRPRGAHQPGGLALGKSL